MYIYVCNPSEFGSKDNLYYEPITNKEHCAELCNKYKGCILPSNSHCFNSSTHILVTPRYIFFKLHMFFSGLPKKQVEEKKT